MRALPRLALVALLALTGACAGARQPSTPATPARAAMPTTSPDDRAAVLAVVRALFDAMRAGDSAAVRAVFHPDVRLTTSLVRAGQPVVEVDSLAQFLRAVGTPHAEVWDERTHDEVVLVDGPLAVAWTPYAFYAGTKFSHCGVDAFQLARTAAGWRIIALGDTRRRTGCERTIEATAR